MIDKRFAAVLATSAILLSACSGAASSSPSASASESASASASESASAPADECVVGVSWNNYQEERWAKWDEPAIKAALDAAGAKYISNDAKSSAETQASNVENLISQGAKVVIVLAQDGTAIKPAVAAAIGNGVPVIAYDRLIEDPKALYITFDNKEDKKEDVVDEQMLQLRKILKTPLEDLDLSVRAFNCLKAAKINSLSQLVTYEQEDLMKFRNFGQKSLAEIEQVLADRGLHFGMDLSKLGVDKEELNQL